MIPIPATRRAATSALAALLAAACLLPAPAAARDDAGEELVSRVYQVRHIDPNDAAMLAHQVCLDRRGDDRTCRYQLQSKGWFTYNTDAETQEAIAAALAAADTPRGSLNLQLTLLMADNESRPDPALAEGEARALADLRQLMPYKGYRLVESGWLRLADRGQLRLGGNPPYVAEIDLDRPLGPDEDSLVVRRFELGIMRLLPGAEGAAQKDFQRLLGSSFSMSVGETVVVGTSRLNGDDEALVVLLTASR
jgi:hypothetical protein